MSIWCAVVKFLRTAGVSYRLEEIITGADERLMIISPFLRINKRIKGLLEEKNRLKIDIRVVYGKSELQPDEIRWLESMRSIRTSFCKDLHAKCYLNEDHALLTSMNLYEYSQVNNYEMGILVNRHEDGELYDEILRETMRIVRISEEIRVKVSKVDTQEVPTKASQRRTTRRKEAPLRKKRTSGYCIRCRDELPFDLEKPYCSDCYRVWNRYKNDEYKEKHCHKCGNEQQTTLRKPVCRKCYKSA